MHISVFFEFQFWLLIVFSLIFPIAILALMLAIRAISPATVLLLGLALVTVAGIDVYLLQYLDAVARLSPSVLDDGLFSSEVSVALYLVPALIGGIGINVVSHVLVRHLQDAEHRFESKHRASDTED